MAYIVENLRLKELAVVAEQNKTAFEDFVTFIKSHGYESLHAFVLSEENIKAEEVLVQYLRRPLPEGVALYDGIARPYTDAKAKWLLLGWIFRDAPEQRLKPMVKSMIGDTLIERQAKLINTLRTFVSEVLPEPTRWEWVSISEVVMDRLEGSRRAIKGTLFEAIVRQCLKELFADNSVSLKISDSEIKLDGETYDVNVIGENGQILIPVKTRETMGGGHALLFTRDIHKSIAVAHNNGYVCIPIIIAESWGGKLDELDCEDHIYLNLNPNQLTEVKPLLANELANRINQFALLCN